MRIYDVPNIIDMFVLFWQEICHAQKSHYWLIKLKLVNTVKCTMNRKELSSNCKSGNHIDCEECVCNCHIPGTMEYMSRNIARLEKERPGLGESLPAFTQQKYITQFQLKWDNAQPLDNWIVLLSLSRVRLLSTPSTEFTPLFHAFFLKVIHSNGIMPIDWCHVASR